jgi:hydroxymethylglutaryl-CoA synthase
MSSGIDALGFAVPDSFLALEDLAVARGVPPEKYLEGIGTQAMAVPGPEDDTVTLATRAAADALTRGRVDPSEIGMLIVGTETAVDHSKPVASFVQGMLGLPRECRVFETKHACFGGTAGLMASLDWIDAGRARGKKALVVCADIARYGLRTPGEPTQGAGAVALVVSEDPRVLRIDATVTGSYANDVLDFWRPLDSKDAFVDGRYSVECYLDAVRGSYRSYRARAGRDHESGLFSRFEAMLYHVPYGKMARKAHAALRAEDGDANPEASFAKLVAPGLRVPARVGNVYTGSLYLSLLGLVAEEGDRLADANVSLFSYGSGSCAELFTGTVVKGARTHVRDVPEVLARRTRLDVATYEAMFAERDRREKREPELSESRRGSTPRFLGSHEGKRIYG